MIIQRVEKFKKRFYEDRLLKMRNVILDSYAHGTAEFARTRILSPEITDPEI